MSDKSSKKDLEKVSRLWVINTDGKPSISATFATIAFLTTTLVYVASVFEKIGPVTIRPFDAAVCSAYLVPIMGLYFGRRWTDSKTTASGSNDKVT